MTYSRMAKFLRAKLDSVGIRTNVELQERLLAKGTSVHKNMISRWMCGRARPQDDKLEALLDVLGVLHPDERRQARELAYVPPDRLTAENREQDPQEAA